MGLFDDWSFEAWVHERTGARIAIFDHTVNWRFWLRRTATHFVRGVLQGDAARRRKLPIPLAYRRFFTGPARNRKAVVSGKKFAVRGALGGRRNIKKKKKS